MDVYLYFFNFILAQNKYKFLRILSAHKLVLSACSEYFKIILSSIKEYSHPVICLDGVSYNDLNSALDYMYCGEVQIEQDSLDKFLTTAKKLKMEGIVTQGRKA